MLAEEGPSTSGTLYNPLTGMAMDGQPMPGSATTALKTNNPQRNGGQQATGSAKANSASSGGGITTDFTAGDGNNDSGMDSVAMGYDDYAGGNFSVAIGLRNRAFCDDSIAAGCLSTTNNVGAIAMGGYYGQINTANGFTSVAMGGGVTANGDHSIALGGYPTANGDYSVALGRFAQTDGIVSTAIGPFAEAAGDYSAAIGFRTNAQADYATVVGTFNNPASDDLFVVGNGVSSVDAWGNPNTDPSGHQYADTPSNALVVKQNGNTTIYGQLTISGTGNAVLIHPQGDLSMGTFTSGPTPQ